MLLSNCKISLVFQRFFYFKIRLHPELPGSGILFQDPYLDPDPAKLSFGSDHNLLD
jgi:hypothetical protein